MAALRSAGLEIPERPVRLFQIMLLDDKPVSGSVVGGKSVIKNDDFSLTAFREENLNGMRCRLNCCC